MPDLLTRTLLETPEIPRPVKSSDANESYNFLEVPYSLPATQELGRPLEWLKMNTFVVTGSMAFEPLTPSVGMDHVSFLPAAAANASYDDLEKRLDLLFDEAEVEPGYTHPVEGELRRMTARPELGKWLKDYYERHPERRRSVLLSVGRIGALQAAAYPDLLGLLRTALRDNSVRIRDAAVRALEALGARGREILKTHEDAVPWLREYAKRVAARA